VVILHVEQSFPLSGAIPQDSPTGGNI
jgi:hypothetical protein